MRLFLFIFFFCYSFLLVAQKTTEVGLYGGVSYYVGDLNTQGHFNPAFLHPVGGVLLRRTLNTRYSIKFNLLYGKISGDDAQSSILQFQERNISFESSLIEFSSHIEFNFYKYNVLALDEGFTASPYVFTGLGVYYFNPKTNIGRKFAEGNKYSSIQPCLPFGLGVKMKFSHRYTTSAEWGLRKSYTDYLDDVSTIYPDGINVRMQRGNSKTKDWYSFAGVVLMIRLGEKPTDCWSPIK